MNPTDIEKTLKAIIEIDEAAVAVEKDTRDIRIQKEKALKQEMRELDLTMMKKARQLGKVERELILAEAEEEVQRIQKETENICQQMQRVSAHHVEELVDTVFKELIKAPLNPRSD